MSCSLASLSCPGTGEGDIGEGQRSEASLLGTGSASSRSPQEPTDVRRSLRLRAAQPVRCCRCYKNNSFSVPPPLLDPVKDKNQPLSSLPPSLKAQRRSPKRFNPNPVALKASGGALRGSQSAHRVIGASSPRLACLWFAPSLLPQYHSSRGSVQLRCLARVVVHVVRVEGSAKSTEKWIMTVNNDKKMSLVKPCQDLSTETKLFQCLARFPPFFPPPPSCPCMNITSHLRAAEGAFIQT